MMFRPPVRSCTFGLGEKKILCFFFGRSQKRAFRPGAPHLGLRKAQTAGINGKPRGLKIPGAPIRQPVGNGQRKPTNGF